MNILTFDIEEWFQCDMTYTVTDWDAYEVRIYHSTDRILDALEKNKQKATFFCMGWIARKHPKVLLKIKNAGHEIGCHSDMHIPITHFDKNEFFKDTKTAIKSIEDVTGDKVKFFRAPAFSITEANTWAFDVLIENGIEIDCSIFPAKHDFGGFHSFGSSNPVLISINGSQIKEFPLNIGSFLGKPLIFSGGGYFRFYPYWFLKRQMLKSNYVMTYFHPRDFDAEQPFLPHLSISRKFKSYYGLKGAYSKFEKLLDEFDFVSLLDASKSINWENIGIIKL